VEGNGHCFIRSTIPVFAWRENGKPRKASACIAGILSENQTGHIAIKSPNRSGLFQLTRLLVT